MTKKMIFVLVTFMLFFCFYAVSAADDPAKEATYQRALEFMEAGQYDNALSIFEMLGDYKESAAQIVICRNAKSKVYYDRAVELFNNGEYDAAKEVFLMLGSFEDSAVQAIRCDTQKKQDQYDFADSLAQNGEYWKAREAFLMLGDFSDSAARVKQMDNAISEEQYNSALELETSGKYEEAIEVYRSLGDYKDAAGHIETCNRQITIRDMNGRVMTAMESSPFDAKAVFALLGEAQELGIDTHDWIEQAYDLETAEIYGNAMYLDNDIDGDGLAERIISGDDGLSVFRREASGLTAASSEEAPRYSSMRVEPDPSGREYLIASDGQSVDVYLMDISPALICRESDPAGDADVMLSASGFSVSHMLSDNPKRLAQTEYVVLGKDQFSSFEYPVVVDMNSYPRVDSAGKLITLYQEACIYDSEAEFEKLQSPEANTEDIQAIRNWLKENPAVSRAELAVWNEDTQVFTCAVDSQSDRLIIHVGMNDNGEFIILGL